MNSPAFGLGIDFGTSNTAAMLRWPDGRVKPVLFEGSPLLPSAVFAPVDGALVVGTDALHRGRFEPGQLEPNPKRHIDDERLLLGSREIAVADLLTAVLRHVAAEVTRVTGGIVPHTAVSYPAGWGTVRRGALLDAARAAGLGEVVLVSEPVASAVYFTTVLGRDVPAGGALIVYDLGAGTFDVSVVRRAGDGFDVVGVDGLTDLGGLDFDATIVSWLAARYAATRPQEWQRLDSPQSPDDRRHRRMLWDDVRVAKEMLSRAPAVLIRPPLLDGDVQFTREEFETGAQPLLARTVSTTAALIRYAGLDVSDVAGLLLVGGSSRIPLVATLLHRTLGIAPLATEQPELIVAEGAMQSVPVGEPVPIAPVSPSPVGPPAPLPAAPVSPAAGVEPAPSPPAPGRTPPPARAAVGRVVPLWNVRPSNPDPSTGHGSRADAARIVATSRNRRRKAVTRAAVSVVALLAALLVAVAGRIALADDDPGGNGNGGGTGGRLALPSVSDSATPGPTASPSTSPAASQSRTPTGPGRTTTKKANTTTPSQDTRPTIPDVVGLSVSAAKTKLSNAGFTTAKVVGRIAPNGSLVDKVVAQDPKGGTRADRGTSVTLFEGQPADPPISPSPSGT
jgi:hypothetical protein